MWLVSVLRKSWDSGSYLASPTWLSYTGAFALLVYAATRMTTEHIGRYSEITFLYIGFIALVLYGGPLRRSSIVWLLLAAVLIPLISWGAAHIHHPQWAEASPKVHRLTLWFVFIPVAVWLGGRPRNVFVLWSFFVFGLMLAPWLSGQGWLELKRGLMGGRVDFGLHNAQHAAMLYATALIGLVVFSRRVFIFKQRGCVLARLLWVLAFIACCFGMFVPQTRGVWLGLCGSALVLLILFLGKGGKKSLLIFISALLIVVAVLLSPASSPFKQYLGKRFHHDQADIAKFLQGRGDDLSFSSVGVRVDSWVEAFRWIEERPLLGWGGNGKGLIFEHSANFSEKMKSFGHLHNSYLDLLVNFGILGGTLLVLLLGWFVTKCIQTWRSDHLPGDMLAFFLSFLVFWLIINCFESYMFFSSGNFIFSLVFGGMLTQIWRADIEKLDCVVQ